MNLGSKIKSTGIPEASETPKDKVVYPTLYVTDVKGLDKLPDGDFSFTGKGRVSSMKQDKKNGTCTCEIEILELEPAGKEKKAAESLDEALSEKESEMEDEMEDMEEEDSEE